ncbi:MAG: enoyl-CoA hydratase/isomerase family protein [Deltaproteobacteria bacterium]|nr:enoyl-CoA hydratase/isomerase family protein [Deltaproteobacteria bacterium]
MELTNIKMEKSEGIAKITLARPKHNVFNIAMMKELNTVLEQLTKDKDLKAAAIFGEGKSWCAGVDVGDHKPDMVSDMIAEFNRIFQLIEKIEVPVIAAVHGACLGGGMEVAIACDIILASDKAVFGQPEIKLGFFPPYAAIRLPALIGVAKAIEVCATGKQYSAKQAQRLGFASQVFESETFAEKVEDYINEIKYSSPLIIRLNKKAIKNNMGLGFDKALESVSDLFLNVLMKTEDTLEGINSFYGKRKPEWKNG